MLIALVYPLRQIKLTCGLIVVDIDALKLQIGVAVVGAGRVDTVLVRDHLPELKWKLTMNTISDIDSKHTPPKYPMISNQSYACGFCVIIDNVERANVPCTDLFWLELLTHPCTDVNGGGPCVRAWMSNQIPLFYMDIITYQCLNADADLKKHQSSASLAFVRLIHRWLVNSPHKGPVTRKMFPFDDVISGWQCHQDRRQSLY